MKRVKPEKPYPDYPLFAHTNGVWAKKINGQTRYFGRWEDPDGALESYRKFLQGETPNLRKVGAGKPSPDFPLTKHKTGRWCKKVRGEIRYFGPVDDPDAALAKWNREKDDLLAGRKPKREGEELTVGVICSRFMNSRLERVRAGELSTRSLADYHATATRIVKAFGRNRPVDDIGPTDFADYLSQIRKVWSSVPVGNEIQRVRSIFRYASEVFDIVVRFGPEFRRPSKKTMRILRVGRERMFEPHELRKVLVAAPVQHKAMILLGVNAGFGNADIGTLPLSALDLKDGWVTYPRPKTGVPRRAKLWKETVAALKAWLKVKPAPNNPAHAHLVFVTRLGTAWHREPPIERISPDQKLPFHEAPISSFMLRLLKSTGVYRPGLSFYTLRHVFETIGGESQDQVAVNHVMGHADASMSAVYRQRISDTRLESVANTVHKWLYGR